MTTAPDSTGPAPDPDRRSRRRRWALRLGLAAVVAAVVGYFAVPWIYINWIREPAPERLTFENIDAGRDSSGATTAPGAAAPSATSAPADTAAPSSAAVAEETWTVVAPSVAGYRVKEVINGQRVEAVGRTNTVDGTVTLQGTTVTSAEVNVDLESVTSDSPRRDGQFRGRLMNTAEFPVATFLLTGPLELSALPGAEISTVPVTGTLILKGVEREVTLDVAARRNGEQIELQGTTEVVFADYGIEDPSIGVVSTEDRGTIEFLLTLAPA